MPVLSLPNNSAAAAASTRSAYAGSLRRTKGCVGRAHSVTSPSTSPARRIPEDACVPARVLMQVAASVSGDGRRGTSRDPRRPLAARGAATGLAPTARQLDDPNSRPPSKRRLPRIHARSPRRAVSGRLRRARVAPIGCTAPLDAHRGGGGRPRALPAKWLRPTRTAMAEAPRGQAPRSSKKSRPTRVREAA